MTLNRSRCTAIAFAVLTAAACRVNRDAVHERVYACDPKAVDPGCGTDRDDAEMMCFAGRTLGGTDFCAQQCAAAPVEGAVCAQSGALLETCDLTSGPGDCGNAALGCFRNNVLGDKGVCVSISPCTNDSDCRDPVRSTCATSFVKKIYNTPTSFKNDRLWCLQAGCQERRTACSPGESCLRDLVPAASRPPDICVPNCDSNLKCPPAHFCWKKVSGPAAPAICLPGLMSFRCEATIDCMMGECLATDGFKMCTVKCGNDSDCTKYDGDQGKFLCHPEARHCTTPDAFRGSVCNTDMDCNAGESCSFLSADSAQGNCLTPCGADRACAPRGGVNMTCLPRADGKGAACFPGYFGYPCATDGNCLPGLSCRALGPGAPSVCTSLCAADDDCDKNRWAAGGHCQELEAMAIKVCLTPRATGHPCDRDAQCLSRRCLGRADGSKACAPVAGERP